METFASFADRWKDSILVLKKPASQSTMAGHLRILKQHLGPTPLAGLEYACVQRLFSDMSKGLAPKSVKNVFSTYRNVLGHAKREGLIQDFPIPVLPKMKKTQQQWLTLDQMRKLIAGCSDVYKPFVALLCETGLRIGEAVGLQTGDIDYEQDNLTVNRSIWSGLAQDPKTATAYRSMCISKRLSDLLRGRSVLDSPQAYIFRTSRGTPYWPSEVRQTYLDALCIGNGIPPLGYHGYRRGNATLFASTLGCPERILANRLGHSCKSVTLGTYAMNVDKADVPYVEQAAKLLYGERCSLLF